MPGLRTVQNSKGKRDGSVRDGSVRDSVRERQREGETARGRRLVGSGEEPKALFSPGRTVTALSLSLSHTLVSLLLSR